MRAKNHNSIILLMGFSSGIALSLMISSVFSQQNSDQPPNPAIPGHLEQLQQSLNKLIYQWHGTDMAPSTTAQSQPQNPLSFPGIRHGDGFRTLSAGGAHPLVPLGPPGLFPSSLLVPTPAHLPSTFRLPATVMAQHKAFPMEGSPPHPMLVFSSIVEQQSKRPNGTDKGQNGTDPSYPLTASHPPLTNTVPSGADLYDSNLATVSSDELAHENALRAAPPLAMPIEALNGTEGNGPLISVEATMSSSSATPSSANGTAATDSTTQLGGAQQIFLVPGGGRQDDNGTTHGAAAVDLEAFLNSANLSKQDTKMFLGLVERVLEEEVNRRLENSLNTSESAGMGQRKRQNIAVRTDGRQIVLELPQRNAGDQKGTADDQLEQELEERLGKELKTANTRLFSLASGEQEIPPDQRVGAAHHHHQQQQQKGVVTNVKNSSENGQKAASKVSPATADYKQREQADFDRLLARLKSEQGGDGGGEEDADLLLIVPSRPPERAATTAATPATTTTSMTATTASTTTMPSSTAASIGTASSTASGGMMMNRQHNFWSRHGPRTKFERLVEDYRFRLNGQDSANGLNDLIKALRNSHIGFFDRGASPNSVKILRRID